MPCTLCHQNKPLRRSHIVPEFMYKPMYDQAHRFQALSRNPDERSQTHQKGLREKLLCHDCEQLLANKYENYAATEFYRPALEAMQQPPIVFTMPGLDYRRFKLFLLSLLWRLGSAKPGVFRPASLGSHSEKLRGLLLQDNPGGWLEYPCMITALTLNKKFHGDFTAGAFSTKVEGIAVWAFVLSGFYFCFFVASHAPPEILHPFFIRPSGPLHIGVKEMREIDSLYEFACEIGVANRARRGLQT